MAQATQPAAKSDSKMAPAAPAKAPATESKMAPAPKVELLDINSATAEQLDALPGIERGNAVSAEDVMSRAARPGKRVIVLDETANWKGAGTALTLAESGHEVTVVTGSASIMMEMARTNVDIQMRSRLRELGVRLMPETILREWHGDGATIQAYGGKPEVIAADTLVVSATNVSERSLGDDLGAPTIGDATAARNAAMYFCAAAYRPS